MSVAMRASCIETDLREIDPVQRMTSGAVCKQKLERQLQLGRRQRRPSDKRLIKMDTSGATVELANRRLESGAESHTRGSVGALISSETRGCAMERLKIVSNSELGLSIGQAEECLSRPCLPAIAAEKPLPSSLLLSIDDGANNDDDRADHGECFQFQLHPPLKDDGDAIDDDAHTNGDCTNSDSTMALSSWSASTFKRRHSSTSSFVRLRATATTTTTTKTTARAASAISSSGERAHETGASFYRDKKETDERERMMRKKKDGASATVSTSQWQLVVSSILLVLLLDCHWPIAFKSAPTLVSCNEIISTSNNISSSQSDHFSFLQDQQQQQHQKLKQTNQQIRSQRSPLAASSIFDSLLGISSTAEEASKSNNSNNNQNDANQATHSIGSGGSSSSVSSAGFDHAVYRMGQTSDKVTLPGDILLGGLFPIHMKGTKIDCGLVNRDRGIQRLEAMLYALDRINDDVSLLPGIKLGAILLDSCSSSTYALNQSLEFIRASINTVESSAFECKDKSTPRPKYGSKMIAGVIGGSLSEVSLQVANLLRLFHIPQVSYASTGTALSDKTLYDLFARTVPSDMFQARAIADIVEKLGWSYVSLVSSEGLYGDSGSKEFIKQATKREICIATHVKVSPSDGNSTYDTLVDNLFKRNATGVVLFTRPEDTRELLLACKRARLVRNFAWVAADGWGTHQKLVQGVEEVAWGAITVELQAKVIPGFDQYMKELTPWGNARNPWFSEYWQEWFDCQLQANLVQQQRIASGAPYARRAADPLILSSSQRQQQQQLASSRNQLSSSSPIVFDGDSNNSNNNYDNDNGGESGDSDDTDSAARARRSPGPIRSRCGRVAAHRVNGDGGSKDNERSQSERLDRAQCASSLPPNQLPRTVATSTTPSTATVSAMKTTAESGGVVCRTRRRASFDMSLIEDEASRNVKQFCSPNLRISESNGYRQEQKVQFVVDAVYAMAHALHKAWSHLCGAQHGVVCEALKELNGGEFYTKYLLNVSFKDLAGSEVKFDEHGDGLGRYNIYNYRQIRQQNLPPNKDIVTAVAAQPNDTTSELDTSLAGGTLPDGSTVDTQSNTTDSGQQTSMEHIYTTNDGFEYSSVGRWTEDDYILAIDDIQFFQGDHVVPESFCSRPCELGQAKIMRAGDHCCWICKTCQPYEYLPDEFNCQDCGIGRWPMPNKTSCYDLPQKYLRWDSVYSLISLSVSCLGIALTLFVTIIFVKYIDTPVVKASGRELSFILLAGVAFCHLATFVLLSKPTLIVCGGQRFLVNFGFALMYGSLLVKTNRISRIFNCARKSAKRPSFISPRSQMLITGILVGIQIFLTIVWFIFEPPGVRADSPEGKRDEVILKCRVKGKSFILSLVYNMILITTCTVYAVKTRKIPENFNESKFIGFTMYTTIVIWLAFVTMFFGTNNSHEIQMNTMCVCISLSAYVTLFCLFSPKISIILLHPDKNVRKLTMNSATYKRAFKPVSSVASVEGRNNLPPGGGSQPDGPSGGPMSTTSNVLNLADTQTMRLQESSIASNAVNSNSGGSNCSQKTPSQQLALTGVCSNCGSHQLMATPAVVSGDHNVNAGGTNLSTKGKQESGVVSRINGSSGEFMPSQGTSNNAYSRQTNECNRWQTTGTSSAGQYQNNAYSKNGNRTSNTNNTQTHHQQQQQQKRLQSNQNDKDSYNAVSGSGRPVGGSSNQITTTNAKVLHNRIASPDSSASVATTRRQIKRISSDENVLADVHCDHDVATTTSVTNSSHTNGNKDHTIANKKRHMGSLNRLNEMTSLTSSDRHCIDESVSSLVNDSFMNTSPDNTPYNVANEGHMSSSVHRHTQCKGSDSMLCNQSLQSIDYCSECCPSLCHCSCPICSSTNGGFENGSGTGLCSHRQNSISVTRAHDDDEDTPSASGNLGDYDAVCVLQLVHQGDLDGEASINDATADNRSSSIEGSDETGATSVRCRQSDEVAGIHVAGTKRNTERIVSKTGGTDHHGTSSEFICPSSGDKNLTYHHHDGASKSSSKTKHSSQAMELQTITSNNSGTLQKNGRTKRSSNSSDTRLDKDSTYSVETGPEARIKSTSSRSSRKRSPSTKSASTTGQHVAGPSVAYALQAAATSALGAATSQIIKSDMSDQQKQRQQETASCGKSASDINLQQSLFGGSSKAISSISSPKHRKIQSISSYVGASGERHQDKYHVQQQQPTSSSVGHVVGTIQASLELVKSDEARRKSVATSKLRRKSGCFNYHDDYEYSYGLVHSNSDSEQDCYFGDETDSCLDIGFGLKHSHQDSLATTGRRRQDENLNVTSYDGGVDGYEEDNDDDDFEHDGRVSLERHYSKRSDRDLKREGSLTRRSRHHHHHQSSSSRRRDKELELSEHRINSVALIAATLSAGGAIMDSGSSATSTAAAMSSQSLSIAAATIKSGDSDQIIGNQPVASVSGDDQYQPALKGINIDADKSSVSSGGHLHQQGMENSQHKRKPIESSTKRESDDEAKYLGTF